MPEKDLEKKKQLLKKASKQKIMAISSVAKQGITLLLAAAIPLVEAARSIRKTEEAVQAIPVIDESTQPNLWQIEPCEGLYRISGENLEGFSRRTDWDNDASVERLRDILLKNGVDRELRRLGAEPGCVLEIAGHKFEWLD